MNIKLRYSERTIYGKDPDGVKQILLYRLQLSVGAGGYVEHHNGALGYRGEPRWRCLDLFAVTMKS